MLTIKRNPANGEFDSDKTFVSVFFGNREAVFKLLELHKGVAIWAITSNDWGGEKFPPKYIALAKNQTYSVNDWLTVYGGRSKKDDEGVLHFKTDDRVLIKRGDWK